MSAATAVAPSSAPATPRALRPLTPLTRATLRRERSGILAWTVGQGMLALYCVLMLDAAYATVEERRAAALTYSTPAASLFTGPGYGLEAPAPTFGALFASQALGWLALIAALMGVLQAVARTRADEDAGPGELLRAAPTGRGESAWAALVATTTTAVLMGGLCALAALAGGLEAGHSLLMGLALALVSVLAAGVALILAALAPSARAARGIGLLFLLAWFLLRGLGDASDSLGALSWLSPIGLVQQMRLFVDLRWAPLVVLTTAALLSCAAGLALHRRRELGEGLVPAPGGRRPSRSGPRGAAALARRTSAGLRGWWMVGGLAFGLTYGLFAPTIEGSFQRQLRDNPTMQAFVGDGLTIQSYLALIISYGGILAAACAVALAGGHVGQEERGLAAAVLAAPVSRAGWLLARVQVLVLGALGMLVAVGAGLVVSALPALAVQGSQAAEEPGRLALGIAAGLVGLLPAALLMGAWMLLACAAAPRWARALGWGGYLLSVIIMVLGPVAQAPQWLLDLSPLTHAPSLPAASGPALGRVADWQGPGVCLVVAVALVVVAVGALRRRDLVG